MELILKKEIPQQIRKTINQQWWILKMINSVNIITKNLKLLKVNWIILITLDEIPMVLLELNESALAYITREQYEKALILLQKAHGVLDVVDISGSKRD